MTRMKNELEWEPRVPLEEGLREVYEWAESVLECNKPVRTVEGDD
jgi:nucleoside-diphosphate-sugar epimerase